MFCLFQIIALTDIKSMITASID